MKTKITNTQVFILIFFIFMLLFLILSLVSIIIAGKEIYHVLYNNHDLVLSGTSGFGLEKKVQNFPYVFSLINYGFNFIFSMQIKNSEGEVLITDWVILYQTGYFFLIIMIPFCCLGFFISIITCLFKLKKIIISQGESSNGNGNNNYDTELLEDLKRNMNQIQDYLINLHKDVKTLKKVTGLITPKVSVMPPEQVNEAQINSHDQDLDLIQEKLEQSYQQQNEMLTNINPDEVEDTKMGIERPKSLVDPTEYIMPKRDENFVNFPTQQFLATEMLAEEKNEKTISLSSIFDRERIETKIEQENVVEEQDSATSIKPFFSVDFDESTTVMEEKNIVEEQENTDLIEPFSAVDFDESTTVMEEDNVVEEQNRATLIKPFPLEFNEPTIVMEEARFREKVGFNLNNYDYTVNDETNNNDGNENYSFYQVGDQIVDNGIEYEIISVISQYKNEEVIYELILKSAEDGTVKSVIKK